MKICTRLTGNAGCKKIAKNSPSKHHRTTLSGYIFAIKARIDNGKKNLLTAISLPHALQYGELRLTSGLDLLSSLGHPCKFQWVSRLGSVTARHSSSERQPNFAALTRGHHLYSAGRPSRWALAHISSYSRPRIASALANILRSRYVARTPSVEARSRGRRSNIENAPRRRPVNGQPATPTSHIRRAILRTPPVTRQSPASRARAHPAERSHYVVISRDGCKLVIRVRVMLP